MEWHRVNLCFINKFTLKRFDQNQVNTFCNEVFKKKNFCINSASFATSRGDLNSHIIVKTPIKNYHLKLWKIVSKEYVQAMENSVTYSLKL